MASRLRRRLTLAKAPAVAIPEWTPTFPDMGFVTSIAGIHDAITSMLCVHLLEKVFSIYSGQTAANDLVFKLHVSWSSDYSKVKKKNRLLLLYGLPIAPCFFKCH